LKQKFHWFFVGLFIANVSFLVFSTLSIEPAEISIYRQAFRFSHFLAISAPQFKDT
jgi:hypothetical protein